jgi:hypothetical protein
LDDSISTFKEAKQPNSIEPLGLYLVSDDGYRTLDAQERLQIVLENSLILLRQLLAVCEKKKSLSTHLPSEDTNITTNTNTDEDTDLTMPVTAPSPARVANTSSTLPVHTCEVNPKRTPKEWDQSEMLALWSGHSIHRSDWHAVAKYVPGRDHTQCRKKYNKWKKSFCETMSPTNKKRTRKEWDESEVQALWIGRGIYRTIGTPLLNTSLVEIILSVSKSTTT